MATEESGRCEENGRVMRGDHCATWHDAIQNSMTLADSVKYFTKLLL